MNVWMMRVARVTWWTLPLFTGHTACSGGSGDPGTCERITCDDPPADRCKDATTLLAHAGTGTCVPATLTCEYHVTERSCTRGCRDGRCVPPPLGELELTIPAGTRLCTLSGWGGDSVQFNWEGKARVDLNAGTIVFPPGDDEIEADPIAGLEVWPGEVAAPVGGSAFLRTVEEQGDVTLHTFELVQAFRMGERSMGVVLRVSYTFEDGEVAEPTVVLDDPTLFAPGSYAGVFVEDWKQISLISCHFEYLEERVRTLLMDNGDRLALTMRGWEEEFTWPQPSMVFNFELVGAVFERGGEVREVTDFFDLSSAVNHHGCCPSYLVHFDEPLGNVHMIWTDEFSYGDKLQYVDGEGNEIESVPYVDVP